MANTFIQDGLVLTTTNSTGSTVSAGDPILAGSTLRIAINDIANGASGPCYAEGVFTIDATTADTFDDGQILYWNAGTSKLTETAGSNKAVAIAVGAKDGSTATCSAKLWPCLV